MAAQVGCGGVKDSGVSKAIAIADVAMKITFFIFSYYTQKIFIIVIKTPFLKIQIIVRDRNLHNLTVLRKNKPE